MYTILPPISFNILSAELFTQLLAVRVLNRPLKFYKLVKNFSKNNNHKRIKYNASIKFTKNSKSLL